MPDVYSIITTVDAAVVAQVADAMEVPEPERVLRESFRVLRAGGRLAVFDGDYATITLATGQARSARSSRPH